LSFPLLPQDGWTALMSASSHNHPEIVEKLLAAGAQPDHQKSVSIIITRIPLSHSITAINFVGHKQLRPILASVSIVRTNTLGEGSSPLAS